ncbi:hypothetical protein TNIN_331851 [Trichonephila inaurata madagascariensis]|uniref:Uncharacterized protein n=1 Tax=Trichonephila inaurata madagascariensis TaxID=2747483 RepID=A0A8X7CRT3_9ARAC|nr:hypothetical protein TNIN_331851 [Trichonephila inaurata madagascariensis]
MVVLRILEASLYLFFSVIADYIEIDLDKERKVIPERDDDKLEGNVVPVVHSLMIFKMCEGLGLLAQLAPESDRKIWALKKKPRRIPKVHSKTILMFCEALNLDAELAHSL